MRIISGIAKGIRLSGPALKSRDIRPTSDKRKEALFSILAEKVVNAKVLDLFAGTGALGLEALSRGAQAVVFIDNNKSSLALIKKNLCALKNSFADFDTFPHVSIIKGELPRALVYIQPEDQNELMQFDLIFLDPPYNRGFASDTLTKLDNSRLLADRGIIIVEESTKVVLPHTYNNFTLLKSRNYGDTGFWLYEKR